MGSRWAVALAVSQAFQRARDALGPEDWDIAFADALAQGCDWLLALAATARTEGRRDAFFEW